MRKFRKQGIYQLVFYLNPQIFWWNINSGLLSVEHLSFTIHIFIHLLYLVVDDEFLKTAMPTYYRILSCTFYWREDEVLVCYFTFKKYKMKINLSPTCKSSLGMFQVYYCFCRQKKTSQFLFFFKIKPFTTTFPNRHLVQREQYLTKY
jgi:hypothetical protein